MRTTEFLIEDLIPQLYEHFNNGYNNYLIESEQILEGTTEQDDVINFIQSYITSPILGKHYFIDTVILSTAEGHKFISLTIIDNKCELLQINNDHIVVKEIVTNKIRRLPEVSGPVFDKIATTLLFDSKKSQAQFLIMFKIKFGQWKLDIKSI